MATKKAGVTVPGKPATIRAKEPELVTISADLQKVHKWFREGSKGIIQEEIKLLQKKQKQATEPPSSKRVRRVASAHELLQRKINDLQNEQERYTLRLKSYWGETGISEIESRHGNSLVGTSMSLAVDPADLARRIGIERFMTLFASMLNPELLLMEAQNDEVLKLAIFRATRVSKSSVKVTAPSSRRAKSGKLALIEEE